MTTGVDTLYSAPFKISGSATVCGSWQHFRTQRIALAKNVVSEHAVI